MKYVFAILLLLAACDPNPKKVEEEPLYHLHPKRTMTNDEIVELIMIQHPIIHQSTYDKLSPKLKKQFDPYKRP